MSWLWIHNVKHFCLFHSFPFHASNWFYRFKHQINIHQPYIPCRRRWNDTLSLIGRLANDSYHLKLLISVSAVTVGLHAADPPLKPLLSNPLNQPSHSCSGSGIMGLTGNPTIFPKTWSGARGQRPLAGKHRGLYSNHSGAIIWTRCILMKGLYTSDKWQEELDSKQWDYDAVTLLEWAPHGQKSADFNAMGVRERHRMVTDCSSHFWGCWSPQNQWPTQLLSEAFDSV